MLPHDVAADESLRIRFQNEVAYLDRTQPSEREMREDARLLGSKDGVLVAAWLWPSRLYEQELDPFDAASRGNRALWESVAGHVQQADAEEALSAVGSAFDRLRHGRRQVVAERFVRIIESTAQAVGLSAEVLETHLRWSAHLTEVELDRLLRGDAPFPFPVIVGLCDALQLEFKDYWVLVDPQRLAHRIDQSVRASEISDHLHKLTLDNLDSVRRKLPQGSVNAEQAQEPGVYPAPRKGSRYRALYETLAADKRDNPDYTLKEIDELLEFAEGTGLPDTARIHRSWWTVDGTRAEGRPQVRAWWAAGYRIRRVDIDDSSDQEPSIGFEALPGRTEWLAKPHRTEQPQYRVPGPDEVPIYPSDEASIYPVDARAVKGIGAGLTVLAEAAKQLTGHVDVLGVMAAAVATVAESLKDWHYRRNVPDDPDIRHLIEFLDNVGEADRSQIEHHFTHDLERSFDPGWMTNLLTRARRQGWTVNKGTRSRPQWVATRLTAELMADIANTLHLQAPAIAPGDTVPDEFLRLVAETVGVPSSNPSPSQIARGIIESWGGTWKSEFESTDKSLTGMGLVAVRDAIELRSELRRIDERDG